MSLYVDPDYWEAGYAEGDLTVDNMVLILLRNKQVTYPVDYPDAQLAGKVVVYDDDGVTPVFTADIFEDADGTTPYRQQGIQNRSRFV